MKIGILGAGHLGKIHIKCIKELDNIFNLVGFYDPDENNAQQTISEYKIKRFIDIDELIDNVDIVDIVTPTVSHFKCAEKALHKCKHLFIEKPLTTTLQEARHLIDIAKEANVKVQVGHVERFNPAFLSVKNRIKKPLFIESHRLSQFNPRGTDVPVVLDLMIHDIDLILHCVNSTVRNISASGVPVITSQPDITNARIEFNNGCVANITASRISLKNMRKMRIFQQNEYIAIDFLKKETEILKLSSEIDNNPLALIIDTGNGDKKQISFEKPHIEQTNAIKKELELFYESITQNFTPEVTIFDGYYALEIAYQIIDKIKSNAINLK